jgi:GntR family transcriptional repressor for pyruvate dehydrogenase complex
VTSRLHASKDSAIAVALDALERIVLDDLKPGDRLPSEAELAGALGVSRLTVREAMRALEARGLVASHKGRRPIVRTPNGDLAGDFFRTAIRRDPSALFELLELRLAIEVHSAHAAALGCSRAAVRELEAAVAAMEALEDEPRAQEAFHDADVRFHDALAAATGNAMLVEPLRTSRRRSWQGRVRDGRPLRPVVEAHRTILDAVVAQDPAAAADAMRAHLLATERDLRDALRDV